MTKFLFLVEAVTQKKEESSCDGILALTKLRPKQKAACGNLPNEQRSGNAGSGQISQHCGAFILREVKSWLMSNKFTAHVHL